MCGVFYLRPKFLTMRYRIEIWTIKQLLDMFDQKRLTLNPPYQRNEIWTERLQRDLISTIKKGLPIPNFFLHERDRNSFDVADGQQRTRAMLQYRNGEISDNAKIKFQHEASFLNYKLSVQIIDSSVSQDEIMEFYVKVNRAGLKLNTAELRKADNFDSRILSVLERLTESLEFKAIDIFTKRQQDRMVDREYIEELAALLLFGVQDKKESAIKKLYESEGTLTTEQLKEMEKEFKNILALVNRMQSQFDFAGSRYSQRNDFYTLFQFIHEVSPQSDNFFRTCFEVLFTIAPDISPSNDECEPFQDYALNCVSQSNSKKAREHRIGFFKDLLLNESSTPNHTQQAILDYYDLVTGVLLKQNGNYFTIDAQKISPKFLLEAQ